MLLEIYDINPLKNFFDVIYDSVQIVEMKLDPIKLSISLLNNSHVAFYNLEISREFFRSYSIQDVESVLLFVEDFYKILRSANKDDTLTLETNDSYLICTFERLNNRRIFELPLAEDFGESPVPPSLEYEGSFKISLDDLKEPCNDLDKIIKTDKFKMIVNNNTLNVVAPIDAMTKYNQIISIDNGVTGNVTVNIEYIMQLLKLAKINKNVQFSIGNNIPLSWSINSADELIKVKGLIAPIIEED